MERNKHYSLDATSRATEGGMRYMWEDLFQVYRRIGEKYTDLMASDMTIDNAILFVRAWMQENFNDQQTSIEIRRQPMDYNADPPKEEREDADS